jgi:hypothetical protein
MSLINIAKGLSPEGKDAKDLCSLNELCENQDCTKYHVKWAVQFCVPFAQGNCEKT